MSAALSIIQDHYAASARGDVDAMVAPFAPDVEWIEMAGFPYAGTYLGPAAVKEGVFGRIAVEWRDYQAVPDGFVVEGDHVVAFGRYSGTYASTGRSMQARFVHHWTVHNGVVVRFEQFADTHLVRQAMEKSTTT
ncbi:MAG TPA: nuclear transport factor 2 family protein [Micromonosporaceae bacterium]|nr:nuclear transport factor 2 family protein [Micromonosporaceae bacterium]